MKRLRHIKHLSENIGPRGSATPNESAAHEYCLETLSRLGYAPQREPFYSTASAYRPFILASALMLVAYLLFFKTAFQFAGVLLAVLSASSAFLELLFLPNPIRWILPKKQSRNVVAVTAAQKTPKQKIVLVAHVDSHRTPLIWHTPLTYEIYRLMSTLGMIAFAASSLAMLASLLLNHRIAPAISIICITLVGVILLMTVQAELSPFTKGANDNASGVGVVLALAEKFAKKPLQHSEIWFVFTGCEEVGAHGSFDFVKKHKHELAGARFIAIDNVAGKDSAPRFYLSETMLRKMVFPKDMVELAQSVADEIPQCGAKPYSQRGAYTDGTPFLLAGIAGIAIVGHRDDGWIPNWHSKTDTFEKVDARVLQSAYGYIERLIDRLDATV